MARVCPLCNKGSMMVTRRVKLRGQYNPTTRTRKSPNLQWARLPLRAAKKAGVAEGSRVKICTQCLKGLHTPKKKRASKKKRAENNADKQEA